MADVEVTQLSKTYHDGIEAVRDCTLTVRDGTCLAVLGPSGCGKSTLLRLVAGLEQPISGRIAVGGQDVTNMPPRRRDVSMVFQDFALYPHMRVRKNLGFAAALNGVSNAEVAGRIERAAEQLGLTDLLDRKPAELSGGERQRVALGRVLVRQPACALFDEPLSHLDTQLRHALRQELRDVFERMQPTSIYVTHDQDEAMTIGDRVAVMNDGTIHQIGLPDEIIHAPANRFVAQFVGNPPMNLIEGVVIHGGGGLTFRAGESFSVSLPDDIAETVREGQSIVLGIRSEAVSLRHESERGGAAEYKEAMPATVAQHEALGGRTILHLRIDDHVTLQAVVTGRHVPAATEIAVVALPADDLYLFAADDNGRLVHAPPLMTSTP